MKREIMILSNIARFFLKSPFRRVELVRGQGRRGERTNLPGNRSRARGRSRFDTYGLDKSRWLIGMRTPFLRGGEADYPGDHPPRDARAALSRCRARAMHAAAAAVSSDTTRTSSIGGVDASPTTNTR